MTDPSRDLRSRRGGRRPGWLLLTVLLVLAIAASSALVFTERVELLKLAVILSLWAAAAAAFVSVIYRRQSDIDRARARDLKLVYDLQLDREISARREYELEVESQLRRELSSELRAEAADEVAALRAELAALRNNLEILFDADLSHRPAIETERTTVRAYSDWQRETGDWQSETEITDPGRRSARFVASAPRQEPDDGSENAIIDVPEEPAVPEEEVRMEPPIRAAEPRWVPPQPEPVAHQPPAPEPQPEERVARHGAPQWQPSAPSGNRVSTNGTSAPVAAPTPAAEATPPQPVFHEAPRRGRHSTPAEPVGAPFGPSTARHGAAQNSYVPPPPTAQPAARHGASDNVDSEQRQGQSVAELLARLQANSTPTGGGRRRRRDG
jgi:hypothetical protein